MDYTLLVAAHLVQQSPATEDEYYASSTPPVWLMAAMNHSRAVLSVVRRIARSCTSMIAKALYRGASYTGL